MYTIAVYSHSNITLIKKTNFLTYKTTQMGSVAKSYIRKGFQIYEKMHKYLTIYEGRPLFLRDFALHPF